jgi:protein-S-isoprenylcysteine O-methyltransferase Ste14
MHTSADIPQNDSSLKVSILKMILQLTLSSLFLSAILFLCAGRVDWPLAWVFILLWLLTKYAYVIILGKRSPDLLLERAQRHENRKRWDKIIQSLYIVFSFITFIVVGLDAGRYHQARDFPLGLVVASYVFYLGFNLLALWASLANPFHSDESRIQSDRGQYVVAEGPYAYVRHPTYLAGVFIWLVFPLMLESLWGLLPGGLAAVKMILRTAFEDRMLHEELPGYREYAQKVRYRLVPDVW